MLAAAKNNKIKSVHIPENLHTGLRIKSVQLGSNTFAETERAVHAFLKKPGKITVENDIKKYTKSLLITEKTLDKLAKYAKKEGISRYVAMGQAIANFLK